MNVKRLIEFDKAYLKIARVWSTLSRAKRKKVGCIVVKDGMIISDGFNGTPTGFDNNCEEKQSDITFKENEPLQTVEQTFTVCLVTKPEVLHAESNAITKLAKSTQSSEGATMYITISPCVDCAKLIIQAGIERVVFGELYNNDSGVKLLKQAGIAVEELRVPSEETV